ncbi:hypothetical protein EV284_6442 [Streptomyces sp. BK022]|uniref:hypothetical protein n=1 Tax=Streptomyces sp. BK022 TaxID=2512123 RepID=UPI00102930D6|nr:hypothetical protein [Streptomyces sp. BK022]RZU28276.1 hypothetical protein EV284_6442 [Streptomyces sp. BK022]
MTVERRASDLPMVLPGLELSADEDLVFRYEQAPDLPGPVKAVGIKDGPVTEAWCPQCQETTTAMAQDNIVAYAPILDGPRSLWPGHQIAGRLLTLTPCGHAFRVMEGQSILQVQWAEA